MAGSFIKIEPLNAENYDTWKVKMRAVLVKNELWKFVNGTTAIPDDEAERENWLLQDEKARADIVLSVCASELSLLDGCDTSNACWRKLEEQFQSKGPVRKAGLLKKIALSRMNENSDIRQHIQDFFDAVNKLKEIGVPIGDDLLAILLLYSLPESYETFRCAMESRDDLPSPGVLRVKILEEAQARKIKEDREEQSALYAGRQKNGKNRGPAQKESRKCYNCQKVGHLARDCRASTKGNTKNKGLEVRFRKNDAVIMKNNNEVLLRAERYGNLYYVDTEQQQVNQIIDDKQKDINLWHYRMGHVNERDLMSMAKSGKVHGLNINAGTRMSQCEVCISEKQAASSYKSATEKRTSDLSEYSEFYNDEEDIEINLHKNEVQVQKEEAERESSSSDEECTDKEDKQKRGRGRPKSLKTGKPGRPRKIYQPATETISEKDKDGEKESDDESGEDTFEECEMAFAAITDDPITLQEAKSSSDAEKWIKAKALYGLRQSGLQWYVKLTESLKDVGLEPTKQDPCFFVKRQEDKILLVTIYVDDLLLASNHPKWLTQTKAHLSKAFEMKDIGPVKSCLGIEFEQDIAKRQVFMSQRKYIDVMLRRFGMIDCKPAMTPIETKCNLKRLEVADQHDMNSQFNCGYGIEHWKAAKRVLRYLKGTQDLGLLFKCTGEKLYGVVDADWGANILDRRSYSGQAFILAGATICWEARKQRTVALSSTESEYLAMSGAVKEALYLKALLNSVGQKMRPAIGLLITCRIHRKDNADMELMDLLNLAWEGLMEFMLMLMNIAYKSNFGMFLVSISVSIIFLMNLKAGSVLVVDLWNEALRAEDIRETQPSPVNIVRRLAHRVLEPHHLEWFNYNESPLAVSIKNNGVTLVINITSHPNHLPYLYGNCLFGNYFFVEAIFKWGGSEHLIDSRRYALELQVLHATNRRDVPFEYLSISYLFIETRRKNAAMEQITESIPAIVNAGSVIELPPFNLANLFWRFHSGYYSYSGTYANGHVVLPTQWFICKSIFHISVEQLDQFETLRNFNGHAIAENSRSIQSLGDRTVQLNEYY
ncbi:hypothetical protein ACLKA6_015731 [Drosophila palustris]